jgi:hypothetical protein
MKPISVRFLLCAFLCLFLTPSAFSQCMMVPVSLEERVTNSDLVISGEVFQQETILDSATMQVYKINRIRVKAWLKKQSNVNEVEVITLGGVYGNRSTVVYPSLQLQAKQEYVLFLQTASTKKEGKLFRRRSPGSIQTVPYAGAQGAIHQRMGLYVDVMQPQQLTETTLLNRIQQISKQEAVTPEGKRYAPSTVKTEANRVMSISSFTPGTTRAGTVVAGDQITISGSGFGASPGFVEFSNADNGGATFITSGLTTDIISWSDNSITVKVPTNAGTGPIRVNGTFTSLTNLNVQYAHISNPAIFTGFSLPTRQRYYLRNLDGMGGYTFQFNTTFAANTAAVASFNRALLSWRCGTGVNFRASGTTAIDTSGNDGVNVVYFDASIPSGTLAVCAINRMASGGGPCTMSNTVWWLSDMDIQFRDIPVTGFTWEYGPAAPVSSEFDFESVALHELGHGHGMGHVIAPGEVMHYAIANGAIARTLSVNDIAAGTDKVGYSDDPTCFNPTGSGTPMTPVTPGSCVTLPITMGELKAKRISQGNNQLNWTTYQELNNDGFIIERGENAQNFKPIGFVKGKELSLEQVEYRFIDATAGPYDWYYRLVQRDLDNHRVGSSIVFVKGEESKQWKVWSSEDGGRVSMYNKESQNSNVQFLLYNASGQLMFSQQVTNGRAEFSFQHLQRGYYSYRIVDPKGSVSGKMILGH